MIWQYVRDRSRCRCPRRSGLETRLSFCFSPTLLSFSYPSSPFTSSVSSSLSHSSVFPNITTTSTKPSCPNRPPHRHHPLSRNHPPRRPPTPQRIRTRRRPKRIHRIRPRPHNRQISSQRGTRTPRRPTRCTTGIVRVDDLSAQARYRDPFQRELMHVRLA